MIHKKCNLGAGIGEYRKEWCYTCWLELNPGLWRKAAANARVARIAKKQTRAELTIAKPTPIKPPGKKCCGGDKNVDYAVHLDATVGSY